MVTNLSFPSPPTAGEELVDWVREYLSPRNRPAYRAHLFTINGYTYPFVRDFSFASVPDPPETNHAMSRRRFSMLAGIFGTRPGDLMFIFQGDPQHPKDDIENRRGFRGIYRVTGIPFRDRATVRHPQTYYEIHGECPNCHEPFATLGEECKLCGRAYPQVHVRAIYRTRPPGATSSFRIHVLSLRLFIEPLVVFARTVGDNRAYMDMTDPGLIWISRSDNAMGAGKGSSIRHLLPEEAVKLTRLFVTEPSQAIILPQTSPYRPPVLHAIENDDGTPSIYPRLLNQNTLQHEVHLNLHIARTIDLPGSSIQRALGDVFSPAIMDYWGSEFPWGYTGDFCDFVCRLRINDRLCRLLIFEFKRGEINDDALVEAILYTRWIAQVCSQFADPPVTEVEVVPIIIGNRNVLKAIPAPFQYNAQYLVGPAKLVYVSSPEVIEYKPVGIFQNSKSGNYYARDLEYTNVSKNLKQVAWQPPSGVATTTVERAWVKDSWIASV
jgi:hypothetical protein